MKLPTLPEGQGVSIGHEWASLKLYTEAQMLQFQRDTLEACAAVCDERANGDNDAQYLADRLRSMK